MLLVYIYDGLGSKGKIIKINNKKE